MVNEYVYCPRLCYIEWVQGEFKDSADTVEGRLGHKRVDRPGTSVQEDAMDGTVIHSRSVTIGSTNLGAIAKIDLLEIEGEVATPVDYKKGKMPDNEFNAYLPEMVQLCVQGLLLIENGFKTTGGVIYYIASKKRVTISFTKELIDKTKEALASMKNMIDEDRPPPPLVDSPRCYGCSLASICLPDETNAMKGVGEEIRRLYPSRDDQTPIYVIGEGHSIRKSEGRIEIWKEGEMVADRPLNDISQLSVYGSANITIPAMVELMGRGVPIGFFSHSGWFNGYAIGTFNKNIGLRMAQFKTGFDGTLSNNIAKMMIYGKIKNCRTLLRRNDKECPSESLETLDLLAERCLESKDNNSLLGIEGAAAQIYFSRFNNMLKSNCPFDFNERNKRPAGDPVNAALSYSYGMLVKDVFNCLLLVGFDPYFGVYHRPKHGKPALALDLMEEFRPIIADSIVMTAFNNGELKESDFIITKIGTSFSQNGKKKLIAAYERRINTEVTHPVFGYTVSYRRIIEVQARLLGRAMTREIDSYQPFLTR
ncbi:MAG: CRISPR-associated endonuclease Cas1 [Methanomassiliicoccales archaeon]|nr:MAG: CRISPR-associated endonuclease Cas1 [Methanomassiliicoccales archaeon]